MKIWNTYGSEHSANLVIIGEFKSVADAAEACRTLDALQEIAAGEPEDDLTQRAFEQLGIGLTDVALDGINRDHRWEQSGSAIYINTDDEEVDAIVRVFLKYRGKIQMYSKDDYPVD